MARLTINEVRHFVPIPQQLAKARELLGWSTTTASDKAKITTDELATLESDPRGGPGLIILEQALCDAGAVFAMFHGPSGTIHKVKLGDGPWFIFTRRGPLALTKETVQ